MTCAREKQFSFTRMASGMGPREKNQIPIFNSRIKWPQLVWFFCSLILASPSSFASESALPQKVQVLPVFLVPTDQQGPSATQTKNYLRHILWAQQRYTEMLNSRDTFSLATNQPLVVNGKMTLAQYRLQAEGGAPTYVSELLQYFGLTRFNCPYDFAILLMNPTE